MRYARHPDCHLGGAALPLFHAGGAAKQRQSDRGERAHPAGEETPQAVASFAHMEAGLETADHKRFSIVSEIHAYFCNPQSPWQRGLNENTNGLLRPYVPKGCDLSRHSRAHLSAVVLWLNQRPRETLARWHTGERSSCSCCVNLLRPTWLSYASTAALLTCPQRITFNAGLAVEQAITILFCCSGAQIVWH